MAGHSIDLWPPPAVVDDYLRMAFRRGLTRHQEAATNFFSALPVNDGDAQVPFNLTVSSGHGLRLQHVDDFNIGMAGQPSINLDLIGRVNVETETGKYLRFKRFHDSFRRRSFIKHSFFTGYTGHDCLPKIINHIGGHYHGQ